MVGCGEVCSGYRNGGMVGSGVVSSGMVGWWVVGVKRVCCDIICKKYMQILTLYKFTQ